jgi:hypothetical protein
METDYQNDANIHQSDVSHQNSKLIAMKNIYIDDGDMRIMCLEYRYDNDNVVIKDRVYLFAFPEWSTNWALTKIAFIIMQHILK